MKPVTISTVLGASHDPISIVYRGSKALIVSTPPELALDLLGSTGNLDDATWSPSGHGWVVSRDVAALVEACAVYWGVRFTAEELAVAS